MMLKCALLLTVVAIGINVTLVSGSCCHKVRAWFNVKNNAYGQRSEYFGYYTMQAGFVNGKAHFLKDDDKGKAIWYHNNSGWMVGPKSHLGSTSGHFYNRSKADCPYTPDYTWKYFDHYGNWRDADKGFSIWCKDDVNHQWKLDSSSDFLFIYL